MKELLEEYGGAILAAMACAILCGLFAFSFANSAGFISTLFSGLISIYL